MRTEAFSSHLREHHVIIKSGKKVIIKSNSAFLSLGVTRRSYMLLMFMLDVWVAARRQECMGVGGNNTKP